MLGGFKINKIQNVLGLSGSVFPSQYRTPLNSLGKIFQYFFEICLSCRVHIVLHFCVTVMISATSLLTEEPEHSTIDFCPGTLNRKEYEMFSTQVFSSSISHGYNLECSSLSYCQALSRRCEYGSAPRLGSLKSPATT